MESNTKKIHWKTYRKNLADCQLQPIMLRITDIHNCHLCIRSQN